MPKSTLQIVKTERETQNRVVALFRDALNYHFATSFVCGQTCGFGDASASRALRRRDIVLAT